MFWSGQRNTPFPLKTSPDTNNHHTSIPAVQKWASQQRLNCTSRPLANGRRVRQNKIHMEQWRPEKKETKNHGIGEPQLGWKAGFLAGALPMMRPILPLSLPFPSLTSNLGGGGNNPVQCGAMCHDRLHDHQRGEGEGVVMPSTVSEDACPPQLRVLAP